MDVPWLKLLPIIRYLYCFYVFWTMLYGYPWGWPKWSHIHLKMVVMGGWHSWKIITRETGCPFSKPFDRLSSVSSKGCSVSPPTSSVWASSSPWLSRKHRSYIAPWAIGCLEDGVNNPFPKIPNISKIQHSTPKRQMISCTLRTCMNNDPLGHFNGITEEQVGLWYRLKGKRREWGIFIENEGNIEYPLEF